MAIALMDLAASGEVFLVAGGQLLGRLDAEADALAIRARRTRFGWPDWPAVHEGRFQRTNPVLAMSVLQMAIEVSVRWQPTESGATLRKNWMGSRPGFQLRTGRSRRFQSLRLCNVRYAHCDGFSSIFRVLMRIHELLLFKTVWGISRLDAQQPLHGIPENGRQPPFLQGASRG